MNISHSTMQKLHALELKHNFMRNTCFVTFFHHTPHPIISPTQLKLIAN